MESIASIALYSVAAVICGFLSLYSGFKSRQAAGVSKSNSIDTNHGGGSFGIGIKSGIMTFIWGTLSIATGLGALVALLALVAVGKASDRNSLNGPSIEVKSLESRTTTDAIKALTTPEVSVETTLKKSVPEAPAVTASGSPDSTTGPNNTASSSTNNIPAESQSKALQPSSSAIQVCEAASNFISKNSCRWEQCAIAENVDKPECKDYQKRD